MTKHLMKRQAPRKEESYWPDACFSRAWGSGPARQLPRQYLGAPGLRFRRRPMPALGSIAGAVVAAGHGSTVVAMAAEGGLTVAVGVGDGSTAGAMAGEVHGSIA